MACAQTVANCDAHLISIHRVGMSTQQLKRLLIWFRDALLHHPRELAMSQHHVKFVA